MVKTLELSPSSNGRDQSHQVVHVVPGSEILVDLPVESLRFELALDGTLFLFAGSGEVIALEGFQSHAESVSLVLGPGVALPGGVLAEYLSGNLSDVIEAGHSELPASGGGSAYNSDFGSLLALLESLEGLSGVDGPSGSLGLIDLDLRSPALEGGNRNEAATGGLAAFEGEIRPDGAEIIPAGTEPGSPDAGDPGQVVGPEEAAGSVPGAGPGGGTAAADSQIGLVVASAGPIGSLNQSLIAAENAGLDELSPGAGSSFYTDNAGNVINLLETAPDSLEFGVIEIESEDPFQPPDSLPPSADLPDSVPDGAEPPDEDPPASGPPPSDPPVSGPPDSGPPDSGPPDSGPPDSGPPASVPPIGNAPGPLGGPPLEVADLLPETAESAPPFSGEAGPPAGTHAGPPAEAPAGPPIAPPDPLDDLEFVPPPFA